MIELMLVAAIVGLLAAIAIPKFGELIIKAKEAAVKGKLGAMRGALNIYYADNEGVPLYYYGAPLGLAIYQGLPCTVIVYKCDDFQSLVPKYIGSIPEISIPGKTHAPSKTMVMGYPMNTPGVVAGDWRAARPEDSAWSYELSACNNCGIQRNPGFKIKILCTHADVSGRIWSQQ